MKLTTIALAAALLAAPALAQTAAPPSDTIKAVIEKGVTIEVGGMSGTIDYKPDGTFSGFDGQFEGTYKADGKKLCITVPGMIDNQCQEYPDGKKSGDTFELTSDMGPLKTTIR
jgi:polyisoprenoid-binding protein YceI